MSVPPLRLIQVPAYSDDRGVFLALTNELPKELKIARAYAISNFGRGVIRGFHRHQKEIKVFFIARGAAKFIAISADNEQDKQTFVLSEHCPAVLVIPPGWYNGWMSLEEDTTLIGLSSLTFEESVADDQRVDPYTFGDVWTVVGR